MAILNKYTKYLIIGLMLLMPILDTKFFYSRITTLFIVLYIFVILLLTLYNNKKSHKSFKFLFIYYLLCFGYLILNYFHSKGFTSLFPNDFNYSLLSEFTTILKLMMPFTLLFVLKYNDIDKKNYYLIIKYWILFISLSIIITNIFKSSISSYGDSTIMYNIFEWKNNLYYTLTASKGFFNYANQEACIMIMLLVIAVYMFFEKNKKNIIYIILLTISMIMLGTRVSTLGGLLTLTFTSIFILIFKLINKQKIKKEYLLIFVPVIIWGLLLPISPYSNRNIELNDKTININYNDDSKNIDKKESQVNCLSKEEKMMKYVDENHDENRMPELFYKQYYSYENDPDFWYSFVKKYQPYEINYRLMEISIIKRINEIDDRNTNILFGISNSRIQNVVNIERDFVLHYYAFGIIGMIILLLVYPFILIKKIMEIIREKNELYNYIMLFIITLFIICSILTVNILNSFTPIIPLIFIVHKNTKD